LREVGRTLGRRLQPALSRGRG